MGGEEWGRKALDPGADSPKGKKICKKCYARLVTSTQSMHCALSNGTVLATYFETKANCDIRTNY